MQLAADEAEEPNALSPAQLAKRERELTSKLISEAMLGK